MRRRCCSEGGTAAARRTAAGRATPAAGPLPHAVGREGASSSVMGRGGGAERREGIEMGRGAPLGWVHRATKRRRHRATERRRRRATERRGVVYGESERRLSEERE